MFSYMKVVSTETDILIVSRTCVLTTIPMTGNIPVVHHAQSRRDLYSTTSEVLAVMAFS